MIRTITGVPVTITGGDVDQGHADYVVHYPDGDKAIEGYICNLRADDGILEVVQAIEAIDR